MMLCGVFVETSDKVFCNCFKLIRVERHLQCNSSDVFLLFKNSSRKEPESVDKNQYK